MITERLNIKCHCVYLSVPGLYSEVDCSSESDQVNFCLIKDGDLLFWTHTITKETTFIRSFY